MRLDGRTLHTAATVMAVLALGCREQAVPQPTPVASAIVTTATASASANASAAAVAPLPDARVDVEGTVGIEPLALTTGVAVWGSDGLMVSLAGAPLRCDDDRARDMSFTVPRGPGGKLFAGGTIALPTSVGGESLLAHNALVTIDAVGPAISGSLRVLGKSWTHKPVDLTGRFSVPVCPATRPLPDAIPEGEPAEEQTYPSALAFRDRDAPPGTVYEVWLFPNTPATCGVERKPNAYSFVVLADVGATRVGDVEAKGPQPVRVMIHPPAPEDFVTGGSAFPDGTGAVVWESFSPHPGGTLRGRVRASSKAGPNATFSARVCP